MKPILLALAMVASSSSLAAGVIKQDILCGSEKQMSKMLSEFEEKPMLMMTSERFDTKEANMMVLFVNPKTRTYTLVEERNTTLYCVIATGNGIQPYTDQSEEKPKGKSFK